MSGINLNQSEVEIKDTSSQHKKEKTQEPLIWPQFAKRELETKSLHTEVASINKITTNAGLNARVIMNKMVKYANNTRRPGKSTTWRGRRAEAARPRPLAPSCPHGHEAAGQTEAARVCRRPEQGGNQALQSCHEAAGQV